MWTRDKIEEMLALCWGVLPLAIVVLFIVLMLGR